ncbi:MAG: DUF1214 domain-containing protein [Bacteroidia bacterium]|nr:MAG: DUF1214 domain-containing protein [Bacteroidia bacterium]
MEEHIEYIVTEDSNGDSLSGEKNYGFHLPPNIPAKKYWSVLVYDSQTSLIIKNGQSWPSVYSTSKDLVINPDGSVDVLLGPKATASREHNWINTLPGKGWTLMLRLYGTMATRFDQTWKPGEIEHLKIHNKPEL